MEEFATSVGTGAALVALFQGCKKLLQDQVY